MATYVPPSGTSPAFHGWTTDAVWSGHEAFFLGSVFYTSGCASGGCERNEAAAYNPSTDTWRPLASPYPVTARDRLFSQWTGTTWIVFGQFYDENTGNSGMDGRRYDPATDTWTDIPEIPSPYLREATAAWSPATDELVVVGGMRLKDGCDPTRDDSFEATNETWVWTLTTNTWRQVANSPLSPRRLPQQAWDGRRLIFAWGRPGDAVEGDWSIPGAAAYDPVTATWEMLPEPPVHDRMAFAEHTIGASRAAFWAGWTAVGDGDFNPTLHDGSAWDRVAGGWQTITDPGLTGTYRMGFATWSANGRLYVWGGENVEENGPSSRFADGAEWDATSSTWQPLPPAPLARSFATAVWTECDAIVYGGDTASHATDNAGMILRL